MHFKNSFLLSLLLILSSPFKSQEVKIFRTCYNFEYPILLELHGVLQPDQEASLQGHYFKAHYGDKSKFYRLEWVEHYYNGKLCPIISNDKYLEYLTGGYGSTNYNSKVAKIVFNYDKENRIERIKFFDTKDIPCHNRFYKSSYQYKYNSNASTEFNANELRYFIHSDGKERESPLVARNTLPLTIHYSNPKLGERKYISKCFIPINSEFTHSYVLNENGILKSKSMEFTYKDGSKKVSTSNYNNNYYEKVSKLGGIHKVELEFDTETGCITQIRKKDINGELYGVNAEITSIIVKENNEFKITTTYKNGKGKPTANYDGQPVEIVILDNQLRKKVSEFYDSDSKKRAMNSSAIARVEYLYTKYTENYEISIVRKTLDKNKELKNIDENSNPDYEIPCEKFTYNSEGEEIKYEKWKDNMEGYFLMPYDSAALIKTNIQITNDLKTIIRNFYWDKEKYVSGEYQTSIDTVILNSDGLIIKSVSYNYPDSKTPSGFEYQYDTCGRITKTKQKDYNDPSKIIEWDVKYSGGDKDPRDVIIESNSLEADRKERYVFQGRELKSINYTTYNNLKVDEPVESYEGSDISGYEYQYDNQGRKIKETVRYIDNPEVKKLISKNEYSTYLDDPEKITFKAIDHNNQEIDYHDFYNEKTHIEQRRLDIWGNVENEISLDINKSPVKKSSIDRKYDKSGNLFEQTKKDLINDDITDKEVYSDHSFNNKPEKISYYKGQNSLIKTSELKYDVFGNITEEKHSDANGLIPFSWDETKKIATISYKYDVNKNCIERSYFDVNDKPVLNDSNIHMYKYSWIKQNNNWVKIAEASFVRDNENENVSFPIIPETKIHSVEYKYDDNGLIIQKAFYGEPKNQSSFKNDIDKQENKGNPAEDLFGIHCYNTRYNVNYFIDSGSFIDKYGKLKINGNDQCSCAKFSYKIGYSDDYSIDTTEWRLINSNDKLFLAHSPETEGYIVKEKDKKVNGYFLFFKDVNGKPIKDNTGISGYKIEFMEDGSFSKININDQRKEIVNKNGYSRIQYHYNDNQELIATLKFKKNKLISPLRIGSYDFSIDGKPLKKD